MLATPIDFKKAMLDAKHELRARAWPARCRPAPPIRDAADAAAPAAADADAPVAPAAGDRAPGRARAPAPAAR